MSTLWAVTVLYGAVLIGLVISLNKWLSFCPGSDKARPAEIPAQPDPFETAYLSDGRDRMLQTVILSLSMKKFLGEDCLPSQQAGCGASRIERAVYDRCVLKKPDSAIGFYRHLRPILKEDLSSRTRSNDP